MGKLADGCPHDLIERNVWRQPVEPAGELLRRDREGRELPRHIETASQGRKVGFLISILTRHALAHRVSELAAEEADQQFQDRVALPGELCHSARHLRGCSTP